MIKRLLILSFCISLISCGAGSRYAHYDEFTNNFIGKKTNDINKPMIKDDWEIETKYCAYNVFYVLYLNPWDLRFSDEGYLKKALKDVNSTEPNIVGLENINMRGSWFTIGLIGYVCNEIIATPIYES